MLDILFQPRSIAVIGASTDPTKVGNILIRNLKESNYQGGIFPVNPRSSEVLGIRSYPSVGAIPAKPDIAVVAVPAPAVPKVLIDCAAAGTVFAVIISAGFKESGREGTRLEEEVRSISKNHGIRVLGPNCLGIISTPASMNASFGRGMLPRGKLAFFSQSGALGIAILDWAIGNRIGFSHFISLGNKVDLNETDFIEYFLSDPQTDVILGYIEDVTDGRQFMEVTRRATRVKPVVLIKSGGTQAGARAASSHTGALAGSETAFAAAFKQTGIIRALGIEDLFQTALGFLPNRFPGGNRLLIITNAGGPGIIAADTSERLGLRLPPMSKESLDAIVPSLPRHASLYNPVDIIGDATSERYRVVLEKAITDPSVDGILVILTPQAMTDVDQVAQAVIEYAGKTDRPILTSFMGERSVRDAVENLTDHGIPNFPYPETAVGVFKKLSDFAAWRESKDTPDQLHSPGREKARESIDGLLGLKKYEVGEEGAMTILSHYGFAFPDRGMAKTAKEAAAIAERIGFPLVMKISSPDILHKTDVGGVKLNIASAAAAEDAFVEITTNVKRIMPHAFINGVMLYEMIQGGKEVILGVTYDRTFGHMIMFGLGGIYVEVLKDVSFRIVPVSRTDALSMVREIKAISLLTGARGEKAVDMEAIVAAIQSLSALVSDFPVIHELDVNPFLVMHRGAFALDARIIFEHR